MVGLIGAGIGAAASLFGGNKAKKERKRMEQYLNTLDADNKAWYNSNYFSDYTQRADTQNLIRNLRDTLERDNKRSENMAVVTGATPEQMATGKERASKAISDTYGNIGAMGQQWKDNISGVYMSRKNDIANQRMGMMDAKASSYENLMNNGLNMMAGAAGNVLGGLF